MRNMMKKVSKKLAAIDKRKMGVALGTAGILAVMSTGNVLAAGWQQGEGANAHRWMYDNGDGTFLANTWKWLDGDEDGTAECYCFDINGYLYTSCQTPDGYLVDKNGAWTENGQVKTRLVGNAKVQFDQSEGKNVEVDYKQLAQNKPLLHTENEVIQYFVNTYIKPDMTDYEKELMIIRYLVEMVHYDERLFDGTMPDVSYDSYGALVNGASVCAGYAKAFNKLAAACGLTSEYVSGYGNDGRHAWNRVLLDGEWYHVDVTWEDPLGDNNYGFDNLRNNYINLTDEQLGKDHSWSDRTPACNGTKYGQAVTGYYLLTGELRYDANDDMVREYLICNFEETESVKRLVNYGLCMDDMSNYFADGNRKEEVKTYLESWFSEGNRSAACVVGNGNANFWWLDAKWMKQEIGGRWDVKYYYVDSDEGRTKFASIRKV